jgi:hypothetical protein
VQHATRDAVAIKFAGQGFIEKRYSAANGNQFKLIQPGWFNDELTEILRQGTWICLLRPRRSKSRISALRISTPGMATSAFAQSAGARA